MFIRIEASNTISLNGTHGEGSGIIHITDDSMIKIKKYIEAI